MDNKLDLSKLDMKQLNMILDKLTPQEKELALSVLSEYANEGHSVTLDSLILEDYAEVPVDIETFVDSEDYLRDAWYDASGNCKLYPYWRKELRKLFPDNISTSVNNTILSGSRGRGKTEIAVLIAAYLLHRILCLKNPIEYFHLKATEKIVFAFMNIKLALAEEIATTKFQNTIKSSPWFLRHGELEGRQKKVWIPHKYVNSKGEEQEAIDIKIGSQADDLIGLPIYFAFFDEISFIKNQDVEKQKEKANDMIDTAIGGMKTRFVHKGKNPTMLVLASSKRSDKSFLEEHMKKKLKSEKANVYISDGSVWDVKPKGTYKDETFAVAVGNKFLSSIIIPEGEDEETYRLKGYTQIIHPPIDFKADFLDDIDRALCDFAGISSSSLVKYINGEAVREIINDNLQNAFTREILTIGTGPEDKEVQYYHFFDESKIPPELKAKPLFIHLDMSLTGDKTGIAGVFIKGKKPSVDASMQDKDLFYTLGFAVSIKAPKGRQISFEKNRQFIRWLKSKGFKIWGISCDTYQSADLQQILAAEGFPIETLSVDRVGTNHICIPYQSFQSAIYEHRLEIFEDKLLIEEITNLERNMDTGKIDHPDGGTKGCFTGETKVRLTDGRSLSFLELVKEYNEGKRNYVYSMNLHDKKIEAKPILKAWKTGENKSLVKLTFDNGESVDCTLNHKFMLRNGEYIEAQDLLPGDSLMPLYVKYPEKGLLTNYRMYYEPFENKWHYEHRQFAQEILDEKYLVHHKDCNPNNNNPDNLIWCSKSMHQKIHSEMQTGAQSEIANDKRRESIKQWHKNNRHTEMYSQRANKTKESVLRYNYKKYGKNSSSDRLNEIHEIEKLFNICWNNLTATQKEFYTKQYRRKLNEVDYKMTYYTSQDYINDIEHTFDIKWDNLTESERISFGVKFSRIKDPTIISRMSKSLSEQHKLGKFENAEKALKQNNSKLRFLKQLFPEIDLDEFEKFFGFRYEELGRGKAAQWMNRYRQKKYELLNHKVVKIEFISKKADVYDIEVQDNHNFALDCGIFVHNSKDKSDAVCGALYTASQHAEEFAYRYGETEAARLTLEVNDAGSMDDLSQLTVSFEEELKKISGMFNAASKNIKENPFSEKATEDYWLLTDNIIM